MSVNRRSIESQVATDRFRQESVNAIPSANLGHNAGSTRNDTFTVNISIVSVGRQTAVEGKRRPNVTAHDIVWSPFSKDALSWLEGTEHSTGLAGIVVRLLRVIRAKDALISAAVALLARLERELRNARSRNRSLLEEFRAYRAGVHRDA